MKKLKEKETKKENWEKKFDKFFLYRGQIGLLHPNGAEDIKSFIRSQFISREELKEYIDFFSKHCENKKAQNMCSACIVLGDLKIKINLPTPF